MRHSSNTFDWIDSNNEKELNWAVKYLIKSNVLILHPDSYINFSPQQILACLQNDPAWWDKPETQLVIKKMRAAKSQRDNRNKQRLEKNKAYCFMMSVDIDSKLKALAGKRFIKQTLEDLINDAALFKKNLKAEMTASIKQPKMRYDYNDDQKIRKLEIIKLHQEKTLDELLKELCTLEHIIEKLSEKPLILEDDRKLIASKYENRKKEINKKLKQELGIFKLSFKYVQADVSVYGDEESAEQKTL